MRYFSLVKIHGVLTSCSERNTAVAVCKEEDRALKINFEQLWYLFCKWVQWIFFNCCFKHLEFFAWQQSVRLLFGLTVFLLWLDIPAISAVFGSKISIVCFFSSFSPYLQVERTVSLQRQSFFFLVYFFFCLFVLVGFWWGVLLVSVYM